MLDFDTASDEDFTVLPSHPLRPSSIKRGFSTSDINYPMSSPKTPNGPTAIRFATYDSFKCSNNLAALGDGCVYKTHNHWGPKHMETLPNDISISVYENYRYSCNSHDNCKAWVSHLLAFRSFHVNCVVIGDNFVGREEKMDIIVRW